MTLPSELKKIIKDTLKDIEENTPSRKRKEAQEKYLKSILFHGQKQKTKIRS